MGISTNPNLDEYGNNHNLCFAPGFTPKFLYLSFSGITCICPPYYHHNPNTTYKLEQSPIYSDFWQFIDTDVNISLHLHSTYSRIDYVGPLGVGVFYSQSSDLCKYYFENFQTDPLFFCYLDGSCQVAWREPAYCPSLAAVQEQLVIDRNARTMAEFGPIGETQFWAQFAQLRDSTNLQIRFDFPHFDQYNTFER